MSNEVVQEPGVSLARRREVGPDLPSIRVSGGGMTAFSTESDRSVSELMETAAERAIDDAGITPSSIDAVYVGNMAAETFNRRTGLANALIGSLGAYGASGDRIENTSASGASAVLRAVETLEGGRSSTALVVGVERMSERDTSTINDIISRLAHDQEYAQGITMPAFAGLAAAEYLRRYAANREALARVAVNNHAHGASNPFAQFRNEISVDAVLDSPLIAEPLRLFDCCPISDGPAAVVLEATEPGAPGVEISGIAGAADTHAVADRADILSIGSARDAANRAIAQAGIARADVDVICLHDAFTILQWLELEAMGFAPPGEAWREMGDGDTGIDGSPTINPGGGLKARGHPLGATGLAQLVELYWQVGDGPPDRSGVPGASTGLAVNVAGFGNNSICTIVNHVT